MNKTKRGKKIEFWQHPSYSWICVECGREWNSQTVARNCKHTNEVTFYYSDEVARPLNIADYLEIKNEWWQVCNDCGKKVPLTCQMEILEKEFCPQCMGDDIIVKNKSFLEFTEVEVKD